MEIEKEKIKKLAKKVIEFELNPNLDLKKEIDYLINELNKFKVSGLFVTLKINKELRGCIGFLKQENLGNAVKKAALNAAFNDPRFMPLTFEELNKLEIEITLLKPLEEIKVNQPEEIEKLIEIGKHGVVISHPYGNGLLLPQVAIEYGFDVYGFIEATCLKAGLNRRAWLDPETKIYRFEGIWF